MCGMKSLSQHVAWVAVARHNCLCSRLARLIKWISFYIFSRTFWKRRDKNQARPWLWCSAFVKTGWTDRFTSGMWLVLIKSCRRICERLHLLPLEQIACHSGWRVWVDTLWQLKCHLCLKQLNHSNRGFVWKQQQGLDYNLSCWCSAALHPRRPMMWTAESPSAPGNTCYASEMTASLTSRSGGGAGSERDLAYLSAPDDYDCLQTPGGPRASPRQQGRPPAKAELTFPSDSSWGDERRRRRRRRPWDKQQNCSTLKELKQSERSKVKKKLQTDQQARTEVRMFAQTSWAAAFVLVVLSYFTRFFITLGSSCSKNKLKSKMEWSHLIILNTDYTKVYYLFRELDFLMYNICHFKKQ